MIQLKGVVLKLYICFVFLLANEIALGQGYISFKASYSAREGLPVKIIEKISEDKEGFIWLLAEEGLVRFDGYDFRLYSFIEYGFRKKAYQDFLFDSDNNIWLINHGEYNNYNVGAQRPSIMVDIFDTNIEEAMSLDSYLADPELSDFEIKNIYAIDSNTVGIISSDGDVWKYCDELSLVYEHSKKHNVNYYFDLSDDRYWLIDDWNIYLYGPKDTLIERERFRYRINNVLRYPDTNTLIIQTSRRPAVNNFWLKRPNEEKDKSIYQPSSSWKHIGYRGMTISNNGIIALANDEYVDFYNHKKGFLKRVSFDSPSANKAIAPVIFYHSSGSLWYSGNEYSIDCIRIEQQLFQNYLEEYDIRGVMGVNDSTVIVNTTNKTMMIDLKSNKITPYFDSLDFLNGNGLLKDGNIVYSGIDGFGIMKIDIESKSQSLIPFQKEIGLCNLKTYMPYIDRLNRFWWGTSCGLILFNRYTEEMELRPINYLEAIEIFCIAELDKELYVGTSKGMYWCGADCDTFARVTAVPDVEIYDFHVDDNQRIWIGTKNAGLMSWKKGQANPANYPVLEGLQGNTIFSLEADTLGNLWMGTQYGLCYLDIEKNKTSTFFKRDGLTQNRFNYLAAFRHSDGSIWMGSAGGLNQFYPEEIQQTLKGTAVTPRLAGVEKLDFQLGQYQRLKSDDQQTILLAANERVVRISYSGLNFPLIKPTTFLYRFGGRDADWLSTTFNEVYYHNIPFGRSSIEIKAQDHSGDILRINFFRKIPFFRTWPFLFVSAALFLLGLWGILRWRTWKIEKDRLALVKEVELKTAEIAKDKQIILHQNNQLKEINKVKDRVFQIVGHEFRDTINSYEELSTTINFWIQRGEYKKITEIADYMEQSSVHLSFLVDNLISWGRIDGSIPHHPRVIELNRILERIKANMTLAVRKKNIALKYFMEEEKCIYADSSMVYIVLRNILNNAIKYSKQGSKVEVYLEESDQKIEVRIVDFGIGMKEDRLKSLMKESMDSMTGTGGEKGVGIGLLLCKRLLTLDKGSITINSKFGKGTTVQLSYPKQ